MLQSNRGVFSQVCLLLNHPTPRPGVIYSLPLTSGADEEINVEGTMPGALDFERGIVKVDFQLWPLFQAVDVDHILTCVEVNSQPPSLNGPGEIGADWV